MNIAQRIQICLMHSHFCTDGSCIVGFVLEAIFVVLGIEQMRTMLFSRSNGWELCVTEN